MEESSGGDCGIRPSKDLVALQQSTMSQAQGKDRCQLVQEEVRVGVEELYASQMVRMCQQGAWTRWEQMFDPSPFCGRSSLSS